MNEELIEKARSFVKAQFDKIDPQIHLAYHNWEHTKKVYDAAMEISSKSEIPMEDQEAIALAALFHDVEYKGGAQGHEERSAVVARNFLEEEQLEQSKIETVERLIKVTRLEAKPEQLDERIIRDADLQHLGSEAYLKSYEKLYEEMVGFSRKKIVPAEWRELCIKFLSNHDYQTDYARENWRPIKLKNIQRLKEMTQEVELHAHAKAEAEKKEKKKNKDKKKKDPNIPEKGIETMFRVTLRNHINLSKIADDKANTLISVNAIILSIVLSALFPKLDSNPFLIYPGFSLLLVSILTIIVSTLSTIPNTSHGSISRDVVKRKQGNLLFFGNFHSMSLADYEWGIDQLMNDKDYLYKSLTRDLYFLGKVLNRKYKLLRYAYLIFVIGLMISILLFVFSIMTLDHEMMAN